MKPRTVGDFRSVLPLQNLKIASHDVLRERKVKQKLHVLPKQV